MVKLFHRVALHAAAVIGASALIVGCATAQSSGTSGGSIDARIKVLPAKATWPQVPAQAPAKDGIASLPGGARLYYWDTGGNGEPIVLLHAATGSAASWEYQQPVLAKAGYRVIAYSRRGSYKSEPTPAGGNSGSAAGDLQELVEYLKLDRFHLVSTAAGGFVAWDYATSHQDKLLSITVANSLGGIEDEEYGKLLRAMLPSSFNQLPPDFRELGPSYRIGNRPGVEQWLHLHELAGGGMGQPQAKLNKVTWDSVAALRVPVLVLTGDADLYFPPWSLREFVRRIPNAEGVIIGEVGHSASWEQPEHFNRELLAFLRKHARR